MKTLIAPSQLPAGQLPLFLVCLLSPEQWGQPDIRTLPKAKLFVLFQEVTGINNSTTGSYKLQWKIPSYSQNMPWTINSYIYFMYVYIMFLFLLCLWCEPFNTNPFVYDSSDLSHSSTLAWKIPWMEEPGRLQSMGSLRVRHDWATSLSVFTFTHWRRKWQPTPVFLPGESQEWWSLVGCHLWGRTESDTTEAT